MTTPAAATNTKKKRFRADDWLALGLEQLVLLGAAGLTVEHMCKVAGRTRGSFYHHFRDHEAFLRALMGYWKTIHTDDVIAQVEAQGNSEDRPRSLHELASRLEHNVDLAVRRLAFAHPVAAELLREVDEVRLSYLAQLYREVDGASPWQAAALAKLDYALFVGSQVLWPDARPASVFEIKALVGKLPRPAS